MPYADNSGVKIHYQDVGQGPAMVFLHEYGGDHRSWEEQAAHFSNTYRCLVVSARGYPPSDVPEDESLYGQDIAIADAFAVMDDADVDTAIVIGLSMGAYTAIRLALQKPKRIDAVIAASGGSGSHLETRDVFKREAAALADVILAGGKMVADKFAQGPTRTQLRRKNMKAWELFRTQLSEHPATGAAFTMRHVQGKRPSLHDFEAELKACTVPTLLMAGDEDEACIDINVWLKRTMPSAGLLMLPKSGHLLNLEDPSGFNAHVDAFLADVEADNWPLREAVAGKFGGVGPVSED